MTAKYLHLLTNVILLFAADKQPCQPEVKITEETYEHKSYAMAAFPEDISNGKLEFRSDISYSILQSVVKLCAFCESQYVAKKSSCCTSVQ